MYSLSVLLLLAFVSFTFAAQVKFLLNVTWAESTLVGTSKEQFLINGQSPGPPINVNVGDTVTVDLINNSPYNTTVHFHGITQLGTPWSDGVPGVSQYPIESGKKFTYQWTADEYGQYWYHSHFKGQVMDGFYGPITIQPSKSDLRPFNLISTNSSDIAAMEAAEANPNVLMVSDWILEKFDTLVAAEQASGYDITCPDAIIINGKGSVECLGVDYYNSLVAGTLTHLLGNASMTAKGCVPPLPALEGPFPNVPSALPASAYDVCTATSGDVEVVSVDASAGWASINLISAAGIDTLEVSIDNHTMYVYATDGAYIVPQPVNAVIIPNGNRYQAMIKLDQTPGNYSVRVASVGRNQFATGYAVLSYKGATEQVNSFAAITYSGANTTEKYRLFADALIEPLTNVTPGDPSTTFFMSVSQLTTSNEWTLSGNSSYNLTTEELITPLLFDPTQALTKNAELMISTKNGSWVDLILRNPGPLAPPHPIHKHSNKGYIIGSGIGPFNHASVVEAIAAEPNSFNLINPPLRDSFTIPAATGNATWLAVRYEVVNPGAFIIHCHIQTHLSGGMAMSMLDGIDKFPTIPKAYLNASSTNRTWSWSTSTLSISTSSTLLLPTSTLSTLPMSTSSSSNLPFAASSLSCLYSSSVSTAMYTSNRNNSASPSITIGTATSNTVVNTLQMAVLVAATTFTLALVALL